MTGEACQLAVDPAPPAPAAMPEGGGRERKTKKENKSKTGGLRQRRRHKGDAEEEEGGWSTAVKEGFNHKLVAQNHKLAVEQHGRKKKGNRHGKHHEDFFDGEGCSESGRFEPPAPWPASDRSVSAAFNIHKLSENLFVSWEDLLGSREGLKRRVDTIAAVHGWEGRCLEDGFLGGVEPSTLLASIKAEILLLDPAAEALETADLLLELQNARGQVGVLGEERDRLAEDVQQLQEDCFEARDQLGDQSTELEKLRQQAHERATAEGRLKSAAGTQSQSGGGEGREGGALAQEAAALVAALGGGSSSADPLAVFKAVLSRGQAVEGRRIVEALERLKLPDEAVMGPSLIFVIYPPLPVRYVIMCR